MANSEIIIFRIMKIDELNKCEFSDLLIYTSIYNQPNNNLLI